jgi:hypothetical protein
VAGAVPAGPVVVYAPPGTGVPAMVEGLTGASTAGGAKLVAVLAAVALLLCFQNAISGMPHLPLL